MNHNKTSRYFFNSLSTFKFFAYSINIGIAVTGMAQAWFPKSWSDKDIRRAGDHVASLKANRHAPDGKPIFGIYKGVRVGVIKTNGTPGTIFPDYDQSAAIRKRRKH